MIKYNFTENLKQVEEQLEAKTELKTIEILREFINDLIRDTDIYSVTSIKRVLFGKVGDTITMYRKDLEKNCEEEFDYEYVTCQSFYNPEEARSIITKIKEIIENEIQENAEGQIINYTGKKDENGEVFDFAFVYRR